MGWSSRYITFTTPEQKQFILNILKEHNECEDYEQIGEEIRNIQEWKLKRKNYFGDKIIIFGNGGGREETFRFIWSRLIKNNCNLPYKNLRTINYNEFSSELKNKVQKKVKNINVETKEETETELTN
jgi:hypothetical protein